MRIAVDIRPLSHPMVGITRYTYELLTRLLVSEHEWYLYSYLPPVHSLPKASNIHVRHAGIRLRGLGLPWSQVVFSRWAKRDQVDVFWSPRHHLPMRLPASVGKVLTIHDLVWKKHPETMTFLGRNVEKLFMPASIAMADKVVTVTETIAGEIEESFSAASSRVSCVYSGLTHIPAKTNPGVVGPYFLFVGTQEPRKNLSRLIRAFKMMRDKNGSLHHKLVLVGGKGWGGEPLRALIEDLSLEDQVILTDRVNEQQLADLYAGCTGLVLPSLYEGFGLPVLEAMGHGRPVLVSRGGAVAEVAGKAGVLVDPMSVESISEGLLCLSNADVQERLSLLAKQRALDFDWDRAAQSILEILQGAAHKN